jgi:hypothetical protein
LNFNKERRKIQMRLEKLKVTLRFLTPMLGTVPKNPEIYRKYIADKSEDPEKETETVEETEEKGWTGFHRDDGGIFIYDYMIKGFLKSAMETIGAVGKDKKIVAYKKWFDRLVFIDERKIHFGLQEPDGVLERPLRAMTPLGPRVTLTRSDLVNEGREISFTVTILENDKKIDFDLIRECLDYGKYVGLGQWRGSGGYGSFEVVEG